jgi:hypothetical protein
MDEEAEVVYLMTQRRQWQPRGHGMNSNMPFNRWNNYSAYNQMSYPPFNQMQYTNQNELPIHASNLLTHATNLPTHAK